MTVIFDMNIFRIFSMHLDSNRKSVRKKVVSLVPFGRHRGFKNMVVNPLVLDLMELTNLTI